VKAFYSREEAVTAGAMQALSREEAVVVTWEAIRSESHSRRTQK
jgi:hypothetical protein